MPVDGFQGNGFVIPAGDGELDAAAGQALQRALEIGEGFARRIVSAQVQALPADFAHDSTPEHVVEIQDDETPRTAVQSRDRGGEIRCRLLEHRRRER